MNLKHLTNWSAVTVLVLAPSCDRKPAATGSDASADSKAATVLIKDGAERKLLAETARQWAEHISNGKAEEVVKLIQIEAIMESTVRELDLDPATRRHVQAGMDAALRNFHHTVAAKWRGRAKFLRIADTDEGTVARIRITGASGVANYMDFIPRIESDRSISIVDFSSHGTGLSTKHTMKQLLAGLAQTTPHRHQLLARLFGGSGSSDQAGKLLNEFITCVRTDKKRAVELYATLPPDFRNNRTLYICYLHAARSLNDDALHMRALEEGKARFPHDPSLAYAMVNLHFKRQEFDQAEQCLLTTMKMLGEDGNLWFWCATMRRLAGNLDAADDAYQRGIALEPDIFHHHMIGIQIAAQRKDYPEVVKRLKLANEGAGDTMLLQPSDDPYLNEAIKSAEYQAYATRFAN